MKEFLSKLRKDYKLGALLEEEVEQEPIPQFEKWMSDAANAGVEEPNAMVLSTVDENRHPHSRVVLLRNITSNGFVFYTNYESNKGQEIAKNPHVSLNFFWVDIERQVRIEGIAEKTSLVQSSDYFSSRPRTNQLSAWASPQSKVLKGRAELEALFEHTEDKFKNLVLLEKPPFWGGFCVAPTLVEFWQGRPGRLHDRLRYTLQKDGTWLIERLAP